MEHLTEDEFQDIYHKHITNKLSDAGSAKKRMNSLHTTWNALVETTHTWNWSIQGNTNLTLNIAMNIRHSWNTFHYYFQESYRATKPSIEASKYECQTPFFLRRGYIYSVMGPWNQPQNREKFSYDTIIKPAYTKS